MILSTEDLRTIDARLSTTANIVTAANQLVYDRHTATDRRDHEEAEQVRAIVPYVDLSRATLATARNATNGNPHEVSAPHIGASKPPRNKSRTRPPGTGRVTNAMNDTLSQLCTIYCSTAEPFDGVERPSAGAGEPLAWTVRDLIETAYGAWSIAHRAYQRALCTPRKPLTNLEFRIQVNGLVHGMRSHIPAVQWPELEKALQQDQYISALAAIMDHVAGGAVTIVERNTLVSLHHCEAPAYPPSLAESLILAEPDFVRTGRLSALEPHA